MEYSRMQKETAIPYAKKFCDENGYDFDKINELDYVCVMDCGAWFLPPAHPELAYLGLKADLATQPRGVLCVCGDFSIETKPIIEQFRK